MTDISDLATEFERVPDMEGFYISSNAPASGKFIPFGKAKGIIEQLREELARIKSIPAYIRDSNICVDDRFGEGFWEAVDEMEKLINLKGEEASGCSCGCGASSEIYCYDLPEG